jgi:hypothetical protein
MEEKGADATAGVAVPVRVINKELKIAVGVSNPHAQGAADRRDRLDGAPSASVAGTGSIELRKIARFWRGDLLRGPQLARRSQSVAADGRPCPGA